MSMSSNVNAAETRPTNAPGGGQQGDTRHPGGPAVPLSRFSSWAGVYPGRGVWSGQGRVAHASQVQKRTCNDGWAARGSLPRKRSRQAGKAVLDAPPLGTRRTPNSVDLESTLRGVAWL